MKPKLSIPCLLLSVSALTVLPIPAEEPTIIEKVEKAVKEASKIEHEVKNQQIAAFYMAIEEQIFVHLNSEASFMSRFSRVSRPMPETYYDHQIVSHDADGNISFKILYIDQRNPETRLKPNTVATGTYNSKTNGLILMDDQTGKPVPAAEHVLVKNGKQAKVGKLDPSTIQIVRP